MNGQIKPWINFQTELLMFPSSIGVKLLDTENYVFQKVEIKPQSKQHFDTDPNTILYTPETKRLLHKVSNFRCQKQLCFIEKT